MSRHAYKPADFDAEAFALRVKHYRRIFAKGVGSNPSGRIKLLIDHAAYTAANAERTRLDFGVPDVIRTQVFRESRLAIRALERALEAKRPAEADDVYGVAV
jgi:hypothetical protein